MSTTYSSTAPRPFLVRRNEGEQVWFMGTRMTLLAKAATTAGQLGMVEALLAPGFGPPLHVHHDEDQACYVLEGNLLFLCGEERVRAAAGDFIYKPRGVAHGFYVEGEKPARVLEMYLPGGFERYYIDGGRPAEGPGLPPQAEPDLALLDTLNARHHVDVGPPVTP
jgi:quercetin dioxygenase-like cupin family protein